MEKDESQGLIWKDAPVVFGFSTNVSDVVVVVVVVVTVSCISVTAGWMNPFDLMLETITFSVIIVIKSKTD